MPKSETLDDARFRCEEAALHCAQLACLLDTIHDALSVKAVGDKLADAVAGCSSFARMLEIQLDAI